MRKANASKGNSLEFEARLRRRRTNIESVILSTLSVAGMVTFATMAPNAVRLLKYVDTDWVSKRDPRQRLQECMSRMRRKGLVRFDTGSRQYRLTSAGTRQSKKIQDGSVRISVPHRWDGRWRMVMFDISEKRRSLRRQVTSLLTSLGFYRMQNSVWVHPYDCEEIVALLKVEKRIGSELLYVIADAVEYDRPLREHFSLPARRK